MLDKAVAKFPQVRRGARRARRHHHRHQTASAKRRGRCGGSPLCGLRMGRRRCALTPALACACVLVRVQGTPKRWEAVTAYVRTRTLDEVLLMVKEKQGMSATRVKAQVRGAALGPTHLSPHHLSHRDPRVPGVAQRHDNTSNGSWALSRAWGQAVRESGRVPRPREAARAERERRVCALVFCCVRRRRTTARASRSAPRCSLRPTCASTPSPTSTSTWPAPPRSSLSRASPRPPRPPPPHHSSSNRSNSSSRQPVAAAQPPQQRRCSSQPAQRTGPPVARRRRPTGQARRPLRRPTGNSRWARRRRHRRRRRAVRRRRSSRRRAVSGGRRRRE